MQATAVSSTLAQPIDSNIVYSISLRTTTLSPDHFPYAIQPQYLNLNRDRQLSPADDVKTPNIIEPYERALSTQLVALNEWYHACESICGNAKEPAPKPLSGAQIQVHARNAKQNSNQKSKKRRGTVTRIFTR
jgi:hypothetical protein